MTNDNKRFRAPPLAITEGMLDAGVKLFEFMAADPENHTDRALVGGVFAEMWRVYWEEIHAVAKKKSKGSPIVQIHQPSRLILPHRLRPGAVAPDPMEGNGVATVQSSERMAAFDIAPGALDAIVAKGTDKP